MIRTTIVGVGAGVAVGVRARSLEHMLKQLAGLPRELKIKMWYTWKCALKMITFTFTLEPWLLSSRDRILVLAD